MQIASIIVCARFVHIRESIYSIIDTQESGRDKARKEACGLERFVLV